MTMKMKELEQMVMDLSEEVKQLRRDLAESKLYNKVKTKPVVEDDLGRKIYDAIVEAKKRKHPMVHDVDGFTTRNLYRIATSFLSKEESGLKNLPFYDLSGEMNVELRNMMQRIRSCGLFDIVKSSMYVRAEFGMPPSSKTVTVVIMFNRDKYKDTPRATLVRRIYDKEIQAELSYNRKLEEYKRDNEPSFL